MITQAELPPNVSTDVAQPVSRTEALLDFVALGCLIAGALAIIKALQMRQAIDALTCLPAAVAACSLICYLYFRKD